MPLVSGRYPTSNIEWLLNGSPIPPYWPSISRWDITASGATGVVATSGTMYVFAMAFMPGDIIGALNILVGASSATPTHGWAAVYNGVGASATLLAQSADNVSGFVAGAQKFTLATPVLVGGVAGTPQGAGAASPGTGGPTVLGVALFNQATTGGKLDGMAGSSVAGAVAVTGQVPLVSSVTGVTGAVAPSTLAGVTAAVSGIPYIAPTRS